MKIYNRPYAEKLNDFEKMWQFLIDDYTAKQNHYIWSTGRLADWKYGLWTEEKYFPSFLSRNAQLWFNEFDQLVGFNISESGNNDFFVFAKQGYEVLYPEMIKWLKDNWGSRKGNLTTNVNVFHTSYISALENQGFVQSNLTCVTRQYDLSQKAEEPHALAADLTIQDMYQFPDLQGKAVLYNNAWSGKETVSRLDYLKYEYNRESPAFLSKYDLSVVDKNGNHLSSCVAFVDYKNSCAEIEKVCTHNAYRKRGLAEAVIRECFKRLYREGIQYAYITGYSDEAKGLYAKLGAVKSMNWFDYTLKKNN